MLGYLRSCAYLKRWFCRFPATAQTSPCRNGKSSASSTWPARHPDSVWCCASCGIAWRYLMLMARKFVASIKILTYTRTARSPRLSAACRAVSRRHSSRWRCRLWIRAAAVSPPSVRTDRCPSWVRQTVEKVRIVNGCAHELMISVCLNELTGLFASSPRHGFVSYFYQSPHNLRFPIVPQQLTTACIGEFISVLLGWL